jgi:hypothetical protein
MTCVAITMVALAAIGARSANPSAGGVTVNAAVIPRATSTTSTSVDITEFREGGDSTCPRLLADCKRYGVCINSPAPIAVLDAVLPQSAASARFTVGVEDGRQFSQCLLSTVNTANTSGAPGFGHFDKSPHPYTYCFKCEDVAVPAGGP